MNSVYQNKFYLKSLKNDSLIKNYIPIDYPLAMNYLGNKIKQYNYWIPMFRNQREIDAKDTYYFLTPHFLFHKK